MYTHYDRTANAVGPCGPPGFKSPILRLLSSSSVLTARPGGLLFSASPDPCAHNARTWPRSHRDFALFPDRAQARPAAMPGLRAASPP
jgi:hypothetical protein